MQLNRNIDERSEEIQEDVEQQQPPERSSRESQSIQPQESSTSTPKRRASEVYFAMNLFENELTCLTR